jgi:hypothetical protein
MGPFAGATAVKPLGWWWVLLAGCAVPSTAEVADCIASCRHETATCLDVVGNCSSECVDMPEKADRQECAARCADDSERCILATLDCLEDCARSL